VADAIHLMFWKRSSLKGEDRRPRERLHGAAPATRRGREGLGTLPLNEEKDDRDPGSVPD
jgi:hypothetical protein